MVRCSRVDGFRVYSMIHMMNYDDQMLYTEYPSLEDASIQ